MAKRPPAKPTVAPANARAGQGQPRPPVRRPKTRIPRVKVEATKVCYYDDKRRRVGDVFTISGETFPAGHPRAGELKEFSSKYMEKVDPRTPERITTGADILREQHDEILGRKIQDTRADLGRSEPTRAVDQGVDDDDDEQE